MSQGQDPYGQNPYGPNPYGPQPQQPYGQGSYPPQNPYQQGYGQANPYGERPTYGLQQGQPAAQPGYGQPRSGQPPQSQASASQPQRVAPKPAIAQHPIVVTTVSSVPGLEVTRVLGEVIGVVARQRELPRDAPRTSQLDGYVAMLTQSRQEAVARMVEMATDAGADAVIGLQFDCSEITQSLSEVSAYGTAVALSGTGPSSADTSSQDTGDVGTAGDEGADAPDAGRETTDETGSAGSTVDDSNTAAGESAAGGGSTVTGGHLLGDDHAWDAPRS